MVTTPGMAFFSTSGGNIPPRPVPDPPNAPIVRNPMSFQAQVYQQSQEMRRLYGHECNQIFKGFFDIGDYFDPYDRQLLGTHFLTEVLNNIAEVNHKACSVFAFAWASKNRDKVNRAKNGEGLAVFTQAEINERGRMFLTYALTVVRRALVTWAKQRVKADSGQAMGAQPGTEVGRGVSSLHTPPKETPDVEVSTSQPQTENRRKGSVSLAPSQPPENGLTCQGRPEESIQVQLKKSPTSETQVAHSNESNKKQEIAQTSASSPEITNSMTLALPTPRTAVSSPAALAKTYQKQRPSQQHIKSQASVNRGPGFNLGRGTRRPSYQSPEPVWMNAQDPRNSHPPAGFTSPPPIPHNSLDEIVMAGHGFMPMQTQPMMAGFPFTNGNQWPGGIPAHQQHQAAPPPRFDHRNSVDYPPMFISNTLKADLSRQATPQMQNVYSTQQSPFVQHPGSFGPPFPQSSPYLGNAALGNITNVENQFGPHSGDMRRVSASRNDYVSPPQAERDDRVFPQENANEYIVQPARDRRPSFAGLPGRKSRRVSFRGDHAVAFHDRHPSSNFLGVNNVQNPTIYAEPFPSYMSHHNPFTVYVSGFPESGSDQEHEHSLRALFSNRIGKNVENVMVRVGRTGKRYALISFFHANDVQEALKLHSTHYMGMHLRVNPKDAFPYKSNGPSGYHNAQTNLRGTSGSFLNSYPNFLMNSGKLDVGNNHPSRNRNTNDRRSFQSGKTRHLNTKYSPQDARSTIPCQGSETQRSDVLRNSTAEAGTHSRDVKKVADGANGEPSKDGRSTPSIGLHGSSTKAKKKTHREEAASVKSEGGSEKIKTIQEETAAGDPKVKELTLNPRNELVDESGRVVYKVKVNDKGEGKAIAPGKSSGTASPKEQSERDSAKSSGSRRQSASTTRSASVNSSKASKREYGGSPGRSRQRQNRQNHEVELDPTSSVSSMNVEESKVPNSASGKAENCDESALRANAESETKSTSQADPIGYAKAFSNIQTPEKSSRKKSKASVQLEKGSVTLCTLSTAIGTPGLAASPEGDESFVTTREDASVTKKDKHSRQSASEKTDGKMPPASTTPKSRSTVHGNEQLSSTSSPATVIGISSANKWMELTPREHSIPDVQKPKDNFDAPKPKGMSKSQEVAKSEDVRTCNEVEISDGPSKSGEAPKSDEVIEKTENVGSKQATNSDEITNPTDAGHSADGEVPESTELPKVEEAPEAGDVAKDDVVLRSNASDSTVGDEQSFTLPPQKVEFDATSENPMQERSTNIEASSSKSGPKQTSSIHPFARQKDQKKKKTKKNKKEQHKGPLYDSKTTNAMIETTESPQQVLFEHLSSVNSWNQNDDENQHISSQPSIIHARMRNPNPTPQQLFLDTQLTPKSSTASKSGREAVSESGSMTMDGLGSTVHSTTFKDGGGQSGGEKMETPEEEVEQEIEDKAMGGEDVSQLFVKERTPAGESGDASGIPQTAGRAAGESQNRNESLITEASHVPSTSTQQTVVENSEICASDATDLVALQLAAKKKKKKKKNEKTRLKAKAKKETRRAAKLAQEEQERELRAASESDGDPKMDDNQIRATTPFEPNGGEQCQNSIETVERGTQGGIFAPLRRAASPKETLNAFSKEKPFQHLCSIALEALGDLDVTGREISKDAVPMILSESDSSDGMEIFETTAPSTMKAANDLPCPSPHPERPTTKQGVCSLGGHAHSSLYLHGADCTSSKPQKVVNCAQESSESSSVSRKKGKGKGKRRAHEMDDEPVEAANDAPGKPSVPSFYDDFEIDADSETYFQREAPAVSDVTSLDEEAKREKVSEIIAALAGMRARFSLQVRMQGFFAATGNETNQVEPADGVQSGGRIEGGVEGDGEEDGVLQEVKDGADGSEEVDAGSSRSKMVKKKSRKGKKNGKKKW